MFHSRNHLILPKMVELVNAWGWGRVWQSEIRMQEVIIFWKIFFLTCGASKCLGRLTQAITHPLLPFSSPILPHVGFLHAAEASCVFILHVGSHSPHFLHAQKFVLVLFSKWVRKIYVLLCSHGFSNGWVSFLPC